MAKRMTIMLIIVAIIFGGAVAWYFVRQAMIAKFLLHQKMPPAVISATQVRVETWHPYLTSIGSLKANQTVEMQPEASGTVSKIYFESGQTIKAGDPLVDLDAQPEKAKLAQDQAQLTLAKISYERTKRLYAQGAAAKQDLDKAESTYQQAIASVQYDQVLIQQKHVVSPFTGRIGIRQVNLGQYLSTMPNSSSVIATIQSLDPIYVDFNLPQQNLQDLQVGQPIQITVDTYPGQTFKGQVSALNVNVDSESRMIAVRATLANPDYKLYDGMFANVRIVLPSEQQAIVVPQTAITFNLYGDLVYVVKDENGHKIAKQVFVKVGESRGDVAVIEQGLTANDTVVTAGQVKLFDGAPVVIKNT